MTEPTFPPNPYIVNRPIRKTENFFGRQALFEFIRFSLMDRQQVILLSGQRRVGKSSILLQIPQRIPLSNFVYVLFDLHDKISQPLPIILEELAQTIISNLGLTLVSPSAGEINRDVYGIFENFLAEVNHHLDGKNLVLLLDEFDVLHDSKQNSNDETFFDYLNVTVQKNLGLFLIVVIGRRLDDLPKFLDIFKSSTHKTIELLDQVSAETLIRQPAQGILVYEREAVQTILAYSAGHTLFTQAICHTIFSQARSQNNRNITAKQVEEAIPETLENQQGALTWFWDGLPIMERVALAAVAEVQEPNNNNSLQHKDVINFLEGFGIQEAGKFAPILEELKKHLFLNNQNKVAVKFIRQWLLKEHPIKRSQSLDQSLRELENVDPEASNLFAIATTLEHQGKKENAYILYKQVLEINPNHFQALFRLAEQSLEKEDFKQAVVYYARAYQFDPLQHKESYVKSLLGYGDQLWSQKNKNQNLEIAKEQFEKSLEIDPNNLLARDKLRSIENFINKQNRDNERHFQRINQRKILVGAIIAVPALIVIGVGIGINIAIGCPSGQTKVFNNCIDPSRFSSGSVAILSTKENSPKYKENPQMNEGMKNFEKGSYEKARQDFQEAIKLEPKNPEPQIYLNNANARQVGNPFVFLAFIPASKEDFGTAKEVLMGIADAQTKFNNREEKDGRLLEIIIVNDENNATKAKEIANVLVKNSSVLAVIGSYSSDVVKTTIPIFKNAGLAVAGINTSSYINNSDYSNFFRVSLSTQILGESLAKNAIQRKIKKVAILYNPQSIYSEPLKDSFSIKFQQLGGKVVKTIPRMDSNIASDPAILKLESERLVKEFQDKVDSIIMIPDAKNNTIDFAIKVAIANSQQSRKLQLLGGNALFGCDTLKQGEEALEGLILVVPWWPLFNYQYTKETEKRWVGTVNWRTAASYDAAQALIHTLSSNATSNSILKNLKYVDLPISETSGEPLIFSKGERKISPKFVQVVKGKGGCSDHVKFEPIK